MAGTPTRSSPAAPKNRRAQRVVPVIPHALDAKNRSIQAQSISENSNQAVEARSSLTAAAVEGEQPSSGDIPSQDELHPGFDAGGGSADHVTAIDDAAHTTPIVKNATPQVEETIEPAPLSSAEAPKVQETPTMSTAATGKVEPAASQTVRELPPPFYPNQPSTSSATSTSLVPEISPLRLPVYHNRPNANGLVFGNFRESADSSPAPGSAVAAPYSQVPYQGYPYPHPGQAPLYPGGHSYHMSEPHAIPMYNPPFVHNTNAFGQPRDFHGHGPSNMGAPRPYYPSHSRFQHPQRRPDEYNFNPRHAPPAARMHPTPPAMHHPRQPVATAQDGARTIHPDVVSGSNTSADGSQHYRHNESNGVLQRPSNVGQFIPQHAEGSIPRQFPQLVNTSSFDDNSNVSQYIHRQFGNREFADYVLELSHTAYLLPAFSLPAHGIILARSPKLRSLMAMQHAGPPNHQPYPKVLGVPIGDKFLNHDMALMQALMRLYGESLPDQSSLARLPTSGAPLASDQMRFALAYAAAGHFLEMDEIISRGLDLAGNVLGWENVGSALAFALEGGLSSNFMVSEGAAEDRASNSSLDDNSAKLESPASAPTYGFYSDRLLNGIIGFLVHQWPADFEFQPTAPQLPNIPRLPAVGEPKYGRANSRLSQIRFGEMAIDDDSATSAATTALSSALISLPFLVLKHVLEQKTLGERIGWSKVAHVMRVVIDERERRRQRATTNKDGTVPESGFEERLWYTVRFVESIERTEDNPTGLKLSRTIATINTPTSSESAKS